MKKISIIIPVFNASLYIKDCVDSILQQSYGDFELIVVNDGSTDDTLDILSCYDDCRIRLFSNENHGTGYSRNFGLEKARYDYICFVDADDRLEHDFLEKMMGLSNLYDADIVCCSFDKRNKKEVVERFDNIGGIACLIALPEKISMAVTGKLFKRTVLDGVLFDLDNHFEDIAFTTRVFLNSKTIIYTSYVGYLYRKCVGSRSSFYAGDDRMVACVECLNLLKGYPLIYDKFVTYALFNSIAIVNMMILNNHYDYELLDRVRKFVYSNISSVKRSGYVFYKKLQIYLFHYFFFGYRFLYRFLK